MKKIQLMTFALVCAAAASSGQAQMARSAKPTRANRVASAAGVVALPAEEPGDSLFRAGREAMTDGDYRKAASLFKQVVDKYPSAKSAGDALYWRAWSLQKLGTDR